MLRDDEARRSFKSGKNTTISWLFSASYAYYILDRPILSDAVFDNLCKYVYDNWEGLEHQHKSLLSKEDMANGSLFSLTMLEYPLIVRASVEQMLSDKNWKVFE